MAGRGLLVVGGGDLFVQTVEPGERLAEPGREIPMVPVGTRPVRGGSLLGRQRAHGVPQGRTGGEEHGGDASREVRAEPQARVGDRRDGGLDSRSGGELRLLGDGRKVRRRPARMPGAVHGDRRGPQCPRERGQTGGPGAGGVRWLLVEKRQCGFGPVSVYKRQVPRCSTSRSPVNRARFSPSVPVPSASFSVGVVMALPPLGAGSGGARLTTVAAMGRTGICPPVQLAAPDTY